MKTNEITNKINSYFFTSNKSKQNFPNVYQNMEGLVDKSYQDIFFRSYLFNALQRVTQARPNDPHPHTAMKGTDIYADNPEEKLLAE